MFIEGQNPQLDRQVYTGAFTSLIGTGLHSCFKKMQPSEVRSWVQANATPPRPDVPRVVEKRACDCCGRTNRTTRCTMVRATDRGAAVCKRFYLGSCCMENLANLARVIDLLHACSLVHHTDKLRMRVAIERVIDAAECAVAAACMRRSGI